MEELARAIGEDEEVWEMEGVSLKRPPPEDFHFDLESHTSQCIAALKFDPAVQRQRYRLVPSTGLTEEAFWRQYFHRLGMVPHEAEKKVAEEAKEAVEATLATAREAAQRAAEAKAAAP